MGEKKLSWEDILRRRATLGQEEFHLLISADEHGRKGDLDAAIVEYDKLLANNKEQLELLELNNRLYPEHTTDILPIVRSMVDSRLRQADYHEALGELEQAQSIRDEATQISEKYLPELDRAERQRHQAAPLISQGRFNEALVVLTAARDLFAERAEPIGVAEVTTNIAGIREWLGDYDKALEEIEQASRFIEPFLFRGGLSDDDISAAIERDDLNAVRDHVKLWGIQLEIDGIRARINRDLGNFAEAERQFREIASRVPEEARLGIDYQLAAILIAEGRTEEGLEYLKRLEPTFRGLARPKWGAFLSYEAEVLLNLDQPDAALEKLDIAIEDLAHYRDPDSLWKVQWRRARALTALKRQAEALEAYVQAAHTINTLRKAPLGYHLDSTYLKDKLPVFEQALDLASARGEAEVCCRLTEMVKSRILTATLSISASNQPKSTSDIDRLVDELSRQADALEYTAYREGWTDDLNQKRALLLSKRADLIERARFSDPRWRTLTEPIPFDLDQTFDLLEERKQAALTLFYQQDHVISVLLYEGKCTVATTQISAKTSRALAKYELNLQSTLPNEWCDLSSGLKVDCDQVVSSSLLEEGLQATSLIVVPHGSLHLLPWSGLKFDGKRLFEYCPVGIVPNLSCLLGLQTQLSSAPRVGLIGAPDYSSLPGLPPIPLALNELEVIENTYRSSTGVVGDVFSAQKATGSNFWQVATHKSSEGNILHVISHGQFVTGDPLNSGLLMTDTKVDAAEIARSALRYDEVVLSACSTGYRPTEVQGIALSGDDILGLPGAFLEAGIRSILVSIPKASDPAAFEFMTRYHEKRTDGLSP
ncbi:MAG: CHAT domain-containing protein, partial [Halobacteriota archaeon]